jgi:hypothetical protein
LALAYLSAAGCFVLGLAVDVSAVLTVPAAALLATESSAISTARTAATHPISGNNQPTAFNDRLWAVVEVDLDGFHSVVFAAAALRRAGGNDRRRVFEQYWAMVD